MRSVRIVLVVLAASSVLALAGSREIVRRAWVPSGERPQGEVREVLASGRRAMEVVLHTRVLRHVVARIREKELRNWPDGRDGADARRRYVEALERATSEVIRAHSPTPAARGAARPSVKVGLLIEIGGDEKGGVATFSDAEVTRTKDGLEIGSARELERVDLPGPYVTRNMELIAADSFGGAPAD